MADLSVLVSLLAEDRASAPIGAVRGSLGELQTTAGGLLPGLGSINTLLGVGMVGAAGAAVAAVGHMVAAASESQRVGAQTDAVLKSTGEAAGFSKTAVEGLATSLSQVTPIDDEVIQSAENMLLTFTAIGKDVMPQATEAVLNMSTALGEDTQSAAVQLGKALNDPINGVTALRRVGVQLSDQQKQQVQDFMAVNNIAGAQRIILQELDKEFGNSARMAGETLPGQIAILQTNFGNLEEDVGMKLIPTLSKATVAMSDLVRGMEGVPQPAGQASTAWNEMGKVIGFAAGAMEKWIDLSLDAITTAAQVVQGDVLSEGMRKDADALLVVNDRLVDGGKALADFSTVQVEATAEADTFEGVLKSNTESVKANKSAIDTLAHSAELYFLTTAAGIAGSGDAFSRLLQNQKADADALAKSIADATAAGDLFSRHPDLDMTLVGSANLQGIQKLQEDIDAAQKADDAAHKAELRDADRQKRETERAAADAQRQADAEHRQALKEAAAAMKEADAQHARDQAAADAAHLAAMSPLDRYNANPDPFGGYGGAWNVPVQTPTVVSNSGTMGGTTPTTRTPSGPSGTDPRTPPPQQNFYGDVTLQVQGGVNDAMNQLALMTS